MNRYFYIDGEGKQKGTFTVEELKNEPVKRDTLVWTQGMSDWTPAEHVPELQQLFTVAQSASQRPEINPPQSQARPQLSSNPIQNHPMPKNYMTEAILATILPFILCGNIFCLLGIIGIVNASKVEPLYMRGLYAEAEAASREARRWSRISLTIAIVGAVLVILFIILLLAFGFNALNYTL